MNYLLEIVNVVAPVFAVIGLGFLLARRGFLVPELNRGLSQLVFYLCAPALLLRSAWLTSLARSFDPRALAVVVGVTLAVSGAVYLAASQSAPSRRGVLAQGAYRSNVVFVSLPILTNAFGPEVLGPAAVLIGFITPLYNFLAVIVLALPHRHAAGSDGIWRKAARDILANPLILACVFGMALSGLHVPLPMSLDRTLDLLGAVAMPAALLSVGASLDLDRLGAELWPTAAVALVKLAIYPALIFAGLKLAGAEGLALKFPVLLFAAPTAVVSHIMAKEMKGDELLAGAIVIGTTLASILTSSGWLLFLHFTP